MSAVGDSDGGGDGKWLAEYAFPPLPAIPVKVQYQPANRFVKIMDADGDVYTWGDKWTVTGAATNLFGAVTQSFNLNHMDQ